MANNLLKPAVFFSGLAALCWIGAGYVGASALALSVVLLIGTCYVAGGLELHRYRQATAALAQAVTGLAGPVPHLADWLAPLPASLRHAVRQRIEGERAALPAPALTPYLVGLLVLLGMLGTLLGMMTTLRGTGLALESATDLDAIRTSLAAPVKGLAFAFGTSIAGVAASAMLGLLSALCRRERAFAVQALDAAIATTLREHSRAHQRDEAFRLLQRQVDTMPTLVEQLRATMAAIEKQSLAAHERQLAQQGAFHERTEAIHARLASSVEQSLKDSVAGSARAAGAALQPVAEATMDVLARNAAALHDNLMQAMERQLDAVSGRLHDSTSTVAGLWTDALAQQRQANAGMTQELRASLEQAAATLDQRSSTLVDSIASRFEAAGDRAGAAWTEVLARQQAQGEALARHNEQALVAATAAFESHASSLIGAVRQSNADVQATLEARTQASAAVMDTIAARFEAASDNATVKWTEALSRQTALSQALAETQQQALEAAATRFEAANDRAGAAWAEVLSRQTAAGEALARDNQQALAAAAAAFESHGASLIDAVQQANAQLHAALDAQARSSIGMAEDLATRFEAASDRATAAWCDALASQTAQGATLAQANAQALQGAAATFESHAASLVSAVQRSHAELQATLEAQMQARAHETLAEISRLVHDAAEAPKAAAAVIAELRQNLSESMVRDTAMLEERSRLLATVETLLGAVNHASAEQRAAVDALITNSADALAGVAVRFTEHVQAETGRLDAAADRITAGAIEVASLGDVFGTAVQRFGEANEQLAARLQAIEGAIDQSMARSDEQLAYYVAQAREVVDLSVLAQKQIIAELQQLAHARTTAEAESA